MEGCFRSELWSTIVPRLVHDDLIVRQAVLALSAIHEHYLDHSATGLVLPDHALRCYQKARQRIIELESPEEFFDSILCACIIFCVCEGLRGDFQEATRHALAGMKIIAARRKATALSAVSMFETTEDHLPNVFLSLSNQAMEANVDHSHIIYPGLQQKMDYIPDFFKNVEEALPHLQTLLDQILKLYDEAEIHHEIYTWVPSQISPSLQPGYEAIRARYDLWSRAVFRLESCARSGDRRQQAGYLLLEIYANFLELNFYVFVHGEETYDKLSGINYRILDLVERFLEIHPDTIGLQLSKSDLDYSTSAKRVSFSFTSSPEIVPVLFEIATRTSDPCLRQKAVQLLRSSGRREGVWDGCVAARLAEKIVQLKQQGTAEAETLHPGRKFLITDILPLSEQKYKIRFGFKKIQDGAFNSFWLETIRPGQGILQTQILDID